MLSGAFKKLMRDFVGYVEKEKPEKAKAQLAAKIDLDFAGKSFRILTDILRRP